MPYKISIKTKQNSNKHFFLPTAARPVKSQGPVLRSHLYIKCICTYSLRPVLCVVALGVHPRVVERVHHLPIKPLRQPGPQRAGGREGEPVSPFDHSFDTTTITMIKITILAIQQYWGSVKSSQVKSGPVRAHCTIPFSCVVHTK